MTITELRVKERVDTLHARLHFTEENRKNLERLADYMEALVRPANEQERQELEKLKSSGLAFAMDCFAQQTGSTDDTLPQDLPHRSCNTVCCLLGHGPLAGIEPDMEILKTKTAHQRLLLSSTQLWLGYAKKFLPDSADYPDGNPPPPRVFRSYYTDTGEIVYDFLFSGGWAQIDNHAEGGVLRIRYVLDFGLPYWPESARFSDYIYHWVDFLKDQGFWPYSKLSN